ncbi:DUF1073 domain-containing protein [Acetobacteraceae bacterium]|nr:DUF1073 domain-containing protein [Acetobacteraceae bacterium]
MLNLKSYLKLFPFWKKTIPTETDPSLTPPNTNVTQAKETPSRRFAQWQAETLLNTPKEQGFLQNLYAPYQAPPNVRGEIEGERTAQIGMDCALSAAPALTDWAQNSLSQSGILKAAFEDGLVFLGYPSLAEMANRPELRKPCHVIAREASREWISFQSTGESALPYNGNTTNKTAQRLKEIENEFERLNVRSLLQKMMEQSLLYGIAHLWIEIEGDPLTSEEQKIPLSATPNGIAKDSLKELRLIEPIWMTPNSYRADNPLAPDYYKPLHWWVQGVLVHRSRLLQMVPYEVSDLLKPAFNFGGLSLTQQLKPYAHNYLRIRNSVANIVANFSKLVLQTDMAANMSAPADDVFGGFVNASGLTGRAKLLQALSEGQDTIIADKESEDIKIISTPLGGLDALQSQSMEAQAAIPGIPLVKLFGVTPKGLNASSEGEIRVFYDEIKAFQQANLRPVLHQIFKLCQLNLWGEIDPALSFEFKPLWQLDPQEQASLEKSKAEIDGINLKNGILSPEEARERLQHEKNSLYASLDLSRPLPQPTAEETKTNPPDPKGAADALWEEAEHPRLSDGTFAEKDMGEAGASTSSPSPALEKTAEKSKKEENSQATSQTAESNKTENRQESDLSPEEEASLEQSTKILNGLLDATEYAGMGLNLLVPGEGEVALPAELAAKAASSKVQKKLIRKGIETVYKAVRSSKPSKQISPKTEPTPLGKSEAPKPLSDPSEKEASPATSQEAKPQTEAESEQKTTTTKEKK